MTVENRHNIPDEFLSPYNASQSEPEMLAAWDNSGLCNPDVCIEQGFTKPDAEHFSIVLPPPNVTGTLHTGHALMLVIQDIMVRYKRMQGFKTLWIPGTDHAAIATQSKVEKNLEKEGVKKRDLGREEFLKRVEQFAQESHDTIVNQCKKMGASLDWSREAFTLDETRTLAVRTAFKKMYDDGLIYQKYRVVNWDPKGQTVISDDEIVYEERTATLYTFKYWKDFPISISTTRPETKVGDVAVAVHPDDARYQQYIGEIYKGVFCGVPLEIKIIADESVDPEFGTGALGVTPAHSKIDWDMAQRHNLPIKQVINEYAKMNLFAWVPENSPDNDLKWTKRLILTKTTEARDIIIEWLKEKSLLENEQFTSQNIATAERTGAIIEPLPKLQWFIDVNKIIPERNGQSLKGLMLSAVRSKSITIIPDHFEKVYFNWIENLQDWCISRQIWYGHRIPAFYDIANEENYKGRLIYTKGNVIKIPKEVLQKITSEEILNSQEDWDIAWATVGGDWGEEGIHHSINFKFAKKLVEKNLISWEDIKQVDYALLDNTKPEVIIDGMESESYLQDPDTLDTWFSSGLWTFSTLGWPNQTDDLKKYHPTSVLETGHDILFFWIARMILMSTYLLGEIPFKTVYLHGMVRAADGQKMSKSLGNSAADPLDIIAKYGNDALRMAMIIGNTPGNDMKLDENNIRGYSKFCNKIWNATRFVLENTSDLDMTLPLELDAEDQASMDELHDLIKTVTKEMNEFKFSLAGEKLYHYFWHTFADVIIERSKNKNTTSSKQLLRAQLELLITTLHPFMPFVTEKIWALLPNKTSEKKLLIIESWPISV